MPPLSMHAADGAPSWPLRCSFDSPLLQGQGHALSTRSAEQRKQAHMGAGFSYS